MKRATLALYLLFGVGAVAAGVAFTVLFVAIHLEGYLAGHGAIRYVAANAVPSVLLTLTAPWSRSQA